MATLDELNVLLDLDIRPLQRGLQQAQLSLARFQRSTRTMGAGLQRMERSTQQTARSLGTMGGEVQKLGRGIPIIGNLKSAFVGLGAVVGTVQIAQFFGDAVSSAAEAETATRKFNVVFGEMASEMRASLGELQKRLPLTAGGLEAAAAGLQDLLVPLGFARRDAADMTREMLRLAGALAEFTPGATINEALVALQAGLRGSFEPLERFGVVLRQSEVNAIALDLGLAKTEKGITDTGRASAFLEGALRKSTDAQAAFADDTVTTERALAEMRRQLDQVKETVGTALLPHLKDLSTSLANNQEEVKAFADAMASLVGTLGDVALAIAGVREEGIKGLLPEGPLKDTLELINKIDERLAKGRESMDIIARLGRGPMETQTGLRPTTFSGLFGPIVQEGEAAAATLQRTLDEAARSVWQPGKHFREDAAEAGREAGATAGKNLADTIEPLIKQALPGFEIGFEAFPRLQRELESVAQRIADLQLEGTLNVGRTRKEGQQLTAELATQEERYQAISDILEGMQLNPAFQQQWADLNRQAEQLREAIDKIGRIPTIAEAAATPGGVPTRAAPGFFGQLWKDIGKTLDTAAERIDLGGHAVVDVLWDMSSGFGNAAQAITRAIGNVISTIGSQIPGIGGVITGLIGSIVNWISSLFKDKESPIDRAQRALRESVTEQLTKIQVLDPNSGMSAALTDFAVRTGDLLLDMGLSAQTVGQGIIDNIDLIAEVFAEGGDRTEAMRKVLEKMQEDFQAGGEDITEATESISSSLKNAATGFRTDLRRFDSTVAGLGPRDPLRGELSALGEAVVARQDNSVNIETINISGLDNPRQIVDAVEREIMNRQSKGGGGLRLAPSAAPVRG